MSCLSRRQSLLALLVSGCFTLSAGAAPVLVTNIKGYGFDDKRQLLSFNELVFDDATGKVVARGNGIAKDYPDASKIDGMGRTLLPGLIDGHGHVLGLGQNLSQVDLRESSSEAAGRHQNRRFCQSQPAGAVDLRPWLESGVMAKPAISWQTAAR